ncbi:MAG TPA: hypothetical protein VFN26_14410 [Candidatus Acidoferrum sp.]|nr:hypothetical protein [Candidatus Acidoferrum sp.]
MEVLLGHKRTEAENKRASGAVSGTVKIRKVIDIASIVNDLRGAVPQSKVAGHGGEGSPGDTYNMVSPVNVGLHLAKVSFYFFGLCPMFYQEIQIVDGQHYPCIPGRRKQARTLVSTVPQIEGTCGGHPPLMYTKVEVIILLRAKHAALPVGNVKRQLFAGGVGVPD